MHTEKLQELVCFNFMYNPTPKLNFISNLLLAIYDDSSNFTAIELQPQTKKQV